MIFLWEIIYHDRLVQLHSLKWMLWDIIITTIVVIAVMVVVEVMNVTMNKDKLFFPNIMIIIFKKKTSQNKKK